MIANAEAPERLPAGLEEAAAAASRELKRIQPARVGDAFFGAALEAAAATHSAVVMERALALAGQASLPLGEQTRKTLTPGGARRYVKQSAPYGRTD